MCHGARRRYTDVVEPLRGEQLETVLRDAAERLRTAFGPCRVYLFGSYADGRPGPDSDLDFLVVVPDGAEDSFGLTGRAYRALGRLGRPADVIVRTESEFARLSGWVSSVDRAVKERGRLLHAA